MPAAEVHSVQPAPLPTPDSKARIRLDNDHPRDITVDALKKIFSAVALATGVNDHHFNDLPCNAKQSVTTNLSCDTLRARKVHFGHCIWKEVRAGHTSTVLPTKALTATGCFVRNRAKRR